MGAMTQGSIFFFVAKRNDNPNAGLDKIVLFLGHEIGE